jgi:hypothetical protein
MLCATAPDNDSRVLVSRLYLGARKYGSVGFRIRVECGHRSARSRRSESAIEAYRRALNNAPSMGRGLVVPRDAALRSEPLFPSHSCISETRRTGAERRTGMGFSRTL